MELPSGQQLVLKNGDATAVVTEVGGGIRAFDVDGTPVLDGYDEHEMCDGARGQVLIPWPNRVRDGRYRWDGQDHQLPLTEPSRSTAIHGLTRWANWELLELHTDEVRLRHRLHAQTGWPFLLLCELHMTLDDGGLTVTTGLTNIGRAACPVAAGAHPYLSAGGGRIDDCVLELPGDTVLPTDEQGIPVRRAPVAEEGLDFRAGRELGAQEIDLTFTDLHRDDLGRAVVRLTRPDGCVAELWADERFPYLEIFTGDTLAPERRRTGLGVEPMTAPPNALQSGEALRVLQPGEGVQLRWGVRLVR